MKLVRESLNEGENINIKQRIEDVYKQLMRRRSFWNEPEIMFLTSQKILKNLSVNNVSDRNTGLFYNLKKSNIKPFLLKYPVKQPPIHKMSQKEVADWNKQDRHIQMGGKYEDNSDHFYTFEEMYNANPESKITQIMIHCSEFDFEDKNVDVTVYFHNYDKPDKHFASGYITLNIPFKALGITL